LTEKFERNSNKPEKAILVAVIPEDLNGQVTDESLEELESLAMTAGAEILSKVVQKRKRLNPATLLGKGKVEELANLVKETNATTIIFENELTPATQMRLSSILNAKVLDRTALILDIFAQHAVTREGKTQVELAQLSYLLPRIKGKGMELSRLGGGIGTRGPGETKLEEDRRRIRNRMKKLSEDIAQMEAVRVTQSKRRRRAGLPSICLVGYTNSGKSTLLNRLTDSTVKVEDKLFSTLDSTTRRIKLPNGRKAVISDTVGFIKNLPHELVAAFYSTLEVVREATLLVHVVDVSAPIEVIEERMVSVREVLTQIGVLEIPSITVFNKSDAAELSAIKYVKRKYRDSIFISAFKGENIETLLLAIEKKISDLVPCAFLIPASRGDLISQIHECGIVTSKLPYKKAIAIEAKIPPEKLKRYAKYIIHGNIDFAKLSSPK